MVSDFTHEDTDWEDFRAFPKATGNRPGPKPKPELGAARRVAFFPVTQSRGQWTSRPAENCLQTRTKDAACNQVSADTDVWKEHRCRKGTPQKQTRRSAETPAEWTSSPSGWTGRRRRLPNAFHSLPSLFSFYYSRPLETILPFGNHQLLLRFLFWLIHLFIFEDSTYKWNHTDFVFFWLISLSIIASRSIHVSTNGKILFYFIAE